MTVRNSINTGLDAEAHRLIHGGLLTPGSSNPLVARDGVFPGGGLTVSQTATASGNLLIGRGDGIVQASNPGQLGVYPFVNDAQVTLPYLSVTPASSQSRVDIVVMRALDQAAGDATTGNKFDVITGTPGSVADPTLPPSCTPLARVRLPANASTVTNAMIEQIRRQTVAIGGVLPVFSQTDENALALYPGMMWVRLDTTVPERCVYDGTTIWRDRGHGSWNTTYIVTPLVGGLPPQGTAIIRQVGRRTPTTVADGDGGAVYSSAFPNGVVSAQIVGAQVGLAHHFTLNTTQTTTQLNFRLRSLATGETLPGVPCTLEFEALGW